jgi:DNA-nicking Smr family endonuclease
MHEVPIEDSIDLHAFQPAEIHIVVEEYLYQAVQRGFREVRIIHGRGIGVQREIVRSILSKHPSVSSFHDLPDRGSTLVRLSLPL